MGATDDGDNARTLALTYELFDGLTRLAPGSAETTRRVLGSLPSMSEQGRVAEFGCGRGIATLVLGDALRHVKKTRIVAIDTHAPYLRTLAAAATMQQLAKRIVPVVADMGAPPIADRSVDLVWAEASIYSIGFARGLETWRPLLRPGGSLAVSELVWLRDPPPEAAAFFSVEYPAMMGLDAALDVFCHAGLHTYEPLVMPETDWSAYYEPLAARLEVFRMKNHDNAEATAIAEATAVEIAMRRDYPSSYGYVFFRATVAD